MLRKIFPYLVAALLIQGCATKGEDRAENQDNKPAWVLNPSKTGFISVVGSAPKQDWGGTEAQHRVAEMKARQELAQMVRVQVKSTSQYKTEVRSNNVLNESNTDTELTSKVDLILEKAKVIEEWTDPTNGWLYLWLTVPN